MRDDVSGLKTLGSKKTIYPNKSGVNAKLLERFPNKFPGRMYSVRFNTSEFTSLCPKTAQPDFGTIKIVYIPDEFCIESKGLKLYMFSWRNEGSFMETITNTMLTDFVKLVNPKAILVQGDFAPRGGIGLVARAIHYRDVRDTVTNAFFREELRLV